MSNNLSAILIEKEKIKVVCPDGDIEQFLRLFGDVSENDQRNLNFKIVGYINNRDRLGH